MGYRRAGTGPSHPQPCPCRWNGSRTKTSLTPPRTPTSCSPLTTTSSSARPACQIRPTTPAWPRTSWLVAAVPLLPSLSTVGPGTGGGGRALRIGEALGLLSGWSRVAGSLQSQDQAGQIMTGKDRERLAVAVGEPRATSGQRCGAGRWLSVAGPSLGLFMGRGLCAEGDGWTGLEAGKATDHSLCLCVPRVGSRVSRAPPGANRGRKARGWVGGAWELQLRLAALSACSACREEGTVEQMMLGLGGSGHDHSFPSRASLAVQLPTSSSQPPCPPAQPLDQCV